MEYVRQTVHSYCSDDAKKAVESIKFIEGRRVFLSLADPKKISKHKVDEDADSSSGKLIDIMRQKLMVCRV